MRVRGFAVPAKRWAGKGVSSQTVPEACREGIEAERENIALYDRLLPTVADPEARQILATLLTASRDNHLPAFERCGGGV